MNDDLGKSAPGSGTNHGTVAGMATNLRLQANAEQALRREAERTGRSQQELIREALDHYLGLTSDPPVRTDRDAMVSLGVVLPARTAFREVGQLVRLPDDFTTGDLLDREDRD